MQSAPMSDRLATNAPRFMGHAVTPAGATLAGVSLLLAALVGGASSEPRALFAAWLAAWWFAVGLVLGGCGTLWIHALTGGRWGHVLRPALLTVVARRAWLAPLFIPIAIGLRSLYPWAAGDGSAFKTLDQPGFAQAWLSLPAFGARCLCYAAAVGWLPASARLPAIGRARAAVSLMLFGLLGSLAATDFLMSLVPGWRSAGFPLLVLVSQLLGGSAALIAWCALRTPHTLRAEAAADVPVARDLGNLLLMFVMVWAYLGFMQFLVIWAENLPPEISWFVPRLQTGWYAVGVVLVALQLAVPMAALVMRRLKDQPASLAMIALAVLAAHALDAVWLVVPSVTPHALATWWLAPLCMAGMSLLLFAPCLAARQPSRGAHAHDHAHDHAHAHDHDQEARYDVA